MKRFLLVSVMIVFSFTAYSQGTKVVLQPDSQCGKDALIWVADAPGYDNEVTNYGSSPTLLIHSWTTMSMRDDARTLIQFDLSGIPLNSTVTSAHLSLYNDSTTASYNGQHQNLVGTNESFITRVTTPWNEHEVTWNTMPLTTANNMVLVPASTTPHEDFLNIDVTALVNDMLAQPDSSFGFMMTLQNETPYKALVFASSDHANPVRRPRLVLAYTTPPSDSVCYRFRLDAGCRKDGFVWRADAPIYNNSNTNYNSSHTLLVHSWTSQSLPDNARALLDFVPDEIPSSAFIVSAYLSLFNDPLTVSYGGQHQNLVGFNNSIIQRITSPWDETAVTWNTQPAVTTQNQVSVPASVSPNQDFASIDITQLFQDIVSNPAGSYGIKMTLANETPYKALVFASSKNTVGARHPLLDVCYIIPTGMEPISKGFNLSIYPNPVKDVLTITVNSGQRNFQLEILNVLGEQVYSQNIFTSKTEINLGNQPAGIYFVRFTDETGSAIRKMVLQR